MNFILSFEFFPPKTPDGFKTLTEITATQLAQENPAFFSVTFGAGGSTRTGTLETVMRLQTLGLSTAPHLACVGLTREELRSILKTYQSAGIRHIVALR